MIAAARSEYQANHAMADAALSMQAQTLERARWAAVLAPKATAGAARNLGRAWADALASEGLDDLAAAVREGVRA